MPAFALFVCLFVCLFVATDSNHKLPKRVTFDCLGVKVDQTKSTEICCIGRTIDIGGR